MKTHEVALVGAGPLGIELAIALQRAGIDYVHLEGGQVGQTMYRWPPLTRWFSSSERISIAGVPIQSVSQEKCTREDYLAYLRSVVLQFDLDIRTYERVIELGRRDDGFALTTRAMAGQTHEYSARRVVLTTGGMAVPNRLGIRGEDLPHVSHALEDPHKYFGRHVLIVGGRNSAVEVALRLHHVGAHVTLSYRGTKLPDSVKYWLRPEIEYLVGTGRITAHFGTEPKLIQPGHVELRSVDGGGHVRIPADFVLMMTGYTADMSLFGMAGVELEGDRQVPRFDPATMETNVPGLFVAGTAVAGTQQSGTRVFLENCHVHVDRIVASITGSPPPPDPQPETLVEA
ncbi:MAG: NAD(P)-binding domain-containing protein [Planctomycetota bacterium]|jgi:thioredoxin reductase (NADPH)